MSVSMQQNRIHDSWDVVPLRSLCQKTGTTDPTKNPSSSFEYVDVSSISNELLKITTTTRHTGVTAPSRARKLVQARDVIFATVRPTLKRVALVPDDLDGQIVSTAFSVLRADPAKADPYFIYYSLLTNDFIARMENLQRGASYPAVADSDVLEQEIPVPPLPEQRAIAAVLAKIHAAVEVQDKIVATLKELKAATMAKLFREGLRGEPLKQTEIGEMPESWEAVRVGDLVKLCSGASRPEGLSTECNENTPFPVYGGNGVMGYSSQFLTTQESIIIGRVGAYCGSIHVCPPHSWVTDNALYHRDPVSDKVTLHFLAELLNHVQLNRLQRKGAQPLVTQGTVHNVVIPLSPKPEQQEIARTATLLNRQIETAEQKLYTLKLTFSSMLHLLMTGQVRVKSEIRVAGGVTMAKANASQEYGQAGPSKSLPEGVKRFVEEIARQFVPERIILFGSYAEGSATPDSDMDLLVVMEFEGRARDQAARIGAFMRRDFSLDLLVRRPEDLRRLIESGDPFFREIVEKGEVLYARSK